MSLQTRYGNILEYEGKYICQGVNTIGVMGNPAKGTGGLALQIREAYPKVYEVFKKKSLKLGDAFGVDCGKHIILNIATQSGIGRYNHPFNYTAFAVGLDKIDQKIKGPVAFPMIGCGLGGAHWPKVEEILLTCSNIEPIIYVLNDEVPF